MYLNDFRTETVLEVFDYLFENNTTDILFVGSIDSIKNEKFCVMHYDSMFHRIYVYKLEGLLYPNEDFISELVPKKLFIQKVKPSGFYNKLMK